MKKGMRLYSRYLVAFLIILLASCATTRLLVVWKDEGFHRTMNRVVVVGVFRQPSVRNFFEDEYVRKLKERGVDAVASYTFLPIGELRKKELLMSKIRENGADAALVTRMVDKKSFESYVPGTIYAVPNYYHSWGSYFDYIYQPGYLVREEYAFAETNIYETGSEKLVWAARSETLLSDDKRELIRSFVNTMTEKMAADGLLPSGR